MSFQTLSQFNSSPMAKETNFLNHVVFLPLQLQGPVNAMFKLAELLSLSGLNITFLVTGNIYSRLRDSTDNNGEMTSKGYRPGFQVKAIPDEFLADEQSAAGISTPTEAFFVMKSKLEPIFRDMLITSGGSLINTEVQGPVTCIIADGIWGFPCDVGREIGVPVFAARTISPSCLWANLCFPELMDAGEWPFQGDDLDEMVKSVPGTEAFLRRRDLPSNFRLRDPEDINIRIVRIERQENPKADGLILNSFEELEESILPHMRTLCPNIYTLGPLHAHLKTKIAKQPTSASASNSSSLWKEDRSCLKWLDEQPSKSVIYVSFGTVATLSKDKLIEIWYGLLNSGIKFLWVIRPDSVANDDSDMPEELSEGTKERGFIVEWAPQEDVLGHRSIGGFLTHSGWNSTLESICAGVPMVCWPFFVDQQINSRLVSEVWKVGLDMKDSCDRNVVEKMVRELMVERKEEFLQRAAAMAESAAISLKEGGSSFSNLDRLIKDIESLGRRRT